MTDREHTISLRLDAIIVRLESGCTPVVRWWLRIQKRRLERHVRKGWQG